MNVTLTHQAGYHSKIENDRGHQIDIDNKSGESPKGASPMELLLMGVAGCSSIDIVAILNKQKITFESLKIHVDGSRESTAVPCSYG